MSRELVASRPAIATAAAPTGSAASTAASIASGAAIATASAATAFTAGTAVAILATASAFFAFTAAGRSANRFRIAFAQLGHRGLAGELDAALVVDEQDLDLDLIAHIHHIRHAIDV